MEPKKVKITTTPSKGIAMQQWAPRPTGEMYKCYTNGFPPPPKSLTEP